MELHENRNNTGTTQPTNTTSIEHVCVALVKDLLGDLGMPKAYEYSLGDGTTR